MPQTKNFQIPISLQTDDVNLWYLKISLFDVSMFEISNACLDTVCKDLGIKKSEFVEKTQFLWPNRPWKIPIQ